MKITKKLATKLRKGAQRKKSGTVRKNVKTPL